jgi:hypothetical protein
MSSLPALNYSSAAPESRSTEERLHLRFPIALAVQYKFRRGGIEHRGSGQTLNIGSGGVLFEADEVLRPFDFQYKPMIELALNWPCLLDETCALKLVIRARVLRRDGRQIAVAIDQYKFRTAGHIPQRSVPESASQGK